MDHDDIDRLLDEYAETKEHVENRKPYWLFLDAHDELEWGLFNYFPEAHYKKAVDRAVEEMEPGDGTTHLPQNGRCSTVYYWLNPDTGDALYRSRTDNDLADPFFESVGEAEQYLVKKTGNNTGQYQGMTLYKAKISKVEEAADVLMNQSEIGDFW